jgi:NADPH:quinone reductase-like Zn-dependent oxidoreductase
MKAAQIDSYGDVSNIEIREADKPTINDDQVLIQAGAASLNPFDSAVLAGYAQSMAPLTFPATLGLDVAGTIVEIGGNVTGFAIGDRVYGTANAMFGASGAFAEFVAANAGSIGHSPKASTDAEAASLPTAGISALQALNTLGVQSGQKVFINGGSGGIGSIAIQIAKSRGAYVAATASTDNIDYVKSLGADKVIDYKTQDYKEVIKDYDALLNNVRSEAIDELLATLKQGGKAVSLAGPFGEGKATERGVIAEAQMTHVTTAALEELTTLIEQDSVHATIDKSFELDQIRAAYTALTTESIKGKVTIAIN